MNRIKMNKWKKKERRKERQIKKLMSNNKSLKKREHKSLYINSWG